MDNYYVHLWTANGRDARAGDWRKNTGSHEMMHRQAHRLAHIKASQTYGAEVFDGGATGYDVMLRGVCIASYKVMYKAKEQASG